MGRAEPRFLAVGHLAKAHGTNGELYAQPLTDHPESVYAPGVVLSLGYRDADGPDADLPPLRIAEVRPYKRGYLVTFGGVEDRNQAELLRGHYLYLSVDELEPLADGEFFYHQLLDLDVVTVDGVAVGRVTEVYELSPADMLEVTGGGKQVLIPYLEHVVVEVDVEAGRLVVDPPDGLLDL